jgi:hypothetical protein
MNSARTQSQAILRAMAAMLLYAAVSSAQVPATASTRPLTLNGSAKLLTGPNGLPGLRLTPAQQLQAGSAFTSSPVPFNANYTFSVFFQFRMTNPGGIGAADGMTFVLQTQGANALGGTGGDEGYVGIAPSVAVEFDTWLNSPFDSNDNHVAILTNGVLSDIDPQTPYGVTNCQLTGAFGCMSNGDVWSVWIDYDGANLNVALADNSTTRPANLISYPIDIASILGQSSAYVGFTAGTGSGYQGHYIFNFRPPAPAAAQTQ